MLGPREVNQNTQRDLASLAGEETIFGGFAAEKLKRLQAELEPPSRRYDVVVANPPYMGSSNMNGWLSGWVKERFPDSKRDLCTCFIERGFGMLTKYGYSAMVTMESWMFLSSFERMRKNILHNHCIATMVYMNHMVMRIAFNTCATIFANHHSDSPGLYTKVEYQDLTEDGIPFEFPVKKHGPKHEKGALEALANPDCGWFYKRSADTFEAIPGSPLGYWVGNGIWEKYKSNPNFSQVGHPKVGMQTSNNDRYLRLWWEVKYSEFVLPSENPIWIKYLKGGDYRKWYGNLEYLLHFKRDPSYILQQPHAKVLNLDLLNKPKCTWTDLTSGEPSFRYAPNDTFYDISGHCFFPSSDDQLYLLAYANTSLVALLKKVFNSSFHFQCGDLGKIVVPLVDAPTKNRVKRIAAIQIELSRADWDGFETSWDFKRHPLV